MERTKMALGIAVVALVLSASSNIYTYTILAGLAGDVKSTKDTVNMLVDYAAPEGLEKIIAAKREGKIVVYTIFTTGPASVLMDAFAKKYPFLKVEWYRLAAYQLYEKYLAEVAAGKVNCDVIMLSDPTLFYPMKKDKNLLYYESPAYKNYPEYAKDPGYWCGVRTTLSGIMYNTKFIPKGTIKTWTDLLNPAYKDKLTATDPRIAGTAYTEYYTLKQAFGLDFWKKLSELKVSIETGGPACAEKIASGEKWISYSIQPYLFLEYRDQKKAPVEAVYPLEGVPMAPTPVGIVAQAPHPNAAKLFMDWVLSIEGQKIIVGLGYPSMMIEPLPIPGLENYPIPKAFPMDWDAYDKRHDELVKEWTQIMGFG